MTLRSRPIAHGPFKGAGQRARVGLAEGTGERFAFGAAIPTRAVAYHVVTILVAHTWHAHGTGHAHDVRSRRAAARPAGRATRATHTSNPHAYPIVLNVYTYNIYESTVPGTGAHRFSRRPSRRPLRRPASTGRAGSRPRDRHARPAPRPRSTTIYFYDLDLVGCMPAARSAAPLPGLPEHALEATAVWAELKSKTWRRADSWSIGAAP